MNKWHKCNRKSCNANFSGVCRQPYMRCDVNIDIAFKALQEKLERENECRNVTEKHPQCVIDDHDNDISYSEYEIGFCPRCGEYVKEVASMTNKEIAIKEDKEVERKIIEAFLVPKKF